MPRTFYTGVLMILALIFVLSVPAGAEQLNLTLPHLDWALQVPGEGFTVDFQNFYEDIKGRSFQANNMTVGLVVNIYLEEAKKGGGATKLREHTFKDDKKTRFKLREIREYERDSVAYLSYVVQFGKSQTQNDMIYSYAFFSIDETWVTVRLTRLEAIPNGEAVIQDYMDKVKILTDYSPTSIEYFMYASYYYIRDKFKKAAPFYQSALDLEVAEKSLPDAYWLVLVDNLGMSYGIKGKLDEAQAVFEYGISERPDYPMFYYNLACTYADRKDLDQTLHYLSLAHDNIGNVIEGEVFPDPMEDSSFKRFRKKERFKALIEGWQN